MPYAANALLVDSTNIYAATNAGVYRASLLPALSCYAHFTLYPDTAVPHHWYALNQATGTGSLSYIWSWGDGSPPDTSITPLHIYADSGYYHICLTINDSIGCASTYCDSSIYIRSAEAVMITVDVVTSLPTAAGLPVVSMESMVSIYPNPSVSGWRLTVGNQFLGSTIEMYDEQGRMVMKDYARSIKHEITGNGLAAGVYYLRLNNDNASVIRKLVKL